MRCWNKLTPKRIEWLRKHPGHKVLIPVSVFPSLRTHVDLRVGNHMSRTVLGLHRIEYRETCRLRPLHVREFDHHYEIHADRFNPDWSVLDYVVHAVRETPAVLFLVGAGVLFASILRRPRANRGPARRA